MTQAPSQPPRFDAVLADYLGAVDRGEQPDRRAFLAAHPELAEELAGWFEVQDRMERLAGSTVPGQPTFGLGGGPGFVTVAAEARGERRAEMALPPAQPSSGTTPPTDDPLPAGSLLGQYKLHEVIGEGAMGRVYRARHHHLDRTVAIKVLAPRFCRDGSLVQRFHREARALARLQHAHIVAIHDMGSQGDVHYFVMEHVEGRNLRQILAAGPLSPRRALELVAQVCGALQYAHDQGIVHRDIKPENILLTREGLPKVADFGLAKVLQDELHPGNLTRTDMVIGTYNYMAPEQKQSARVDHRADVYATGVVLYELLTGKLPAGHFALPSRQADLPAGVDDLVLKALAAEPGDRYQRAADLGSDCSSVLVGHGAPAAAGRLAPAASAGELSVTDALDDRRLGGGPAAWVRLIATSDEEIAIHAWSRDQIAVHSEGGTKKLEVTAIAAPTGPWAGAATLGQPGLEIRLPPDETKLFVPEGLPLSISAPEAAVELNGLRSALRVEPGTGAVHVRDHRGRLEIDRLGDGEVTVEGLATSDLHVSTREGALTVSGLRMTTGRGTLHTDDGNLALGLDVEHCALSVEARSLSGTVSCDVTALGHGTARWLSGRLGTGIARLDLDSYSGDVRLGHGADLQDAEMLSQALKSLGWSALWITVAIWADVGWVVWLIVAWWAWSNLQNLFTVLNRLDRFHLLKRRAGEWLTKQGVVAEAAWPKPKPRPEDKRDERG